MHLILVCVCMLFVHTRVCCAAAAFGAVVVWLVLLVQALVSQTRVRAQELLHEVQSVFTCWPKTCGCQAHAMMVAAAEGTSW